MTPKAQSIDNIDKFNFIKIKIPAVQNMWIRNFNEKAQSGRKYLQSRYLVKDLYLEYINIPRTQQ